MPPHPEIPGLESFAPISQTSTTLTWRAYQRSLDRHVMVKLLLHEAASDPKLVEQFVSVSRSIAHIKAEAFCQIYDVYSANDVHYVVMEDVPGQTLSDRIKATPRGSVSQMLRYALNLSDALGKTWDSDRLVHRNLKPTAIHITPAGTAKLTDFGMATLSMIGAVDDQKASSEIVGTPNFIAPEQVNHTHEIDCRTDMYALGLILYFGLTGRLPFGDLPPEQVVRSQVEDKLTHLRDIRPDTPLSVCALIERLLMKNPEDRYSSWGEVIADINRLLEGKPIRRHPVLGTGLSTLAPPTLVSPLKNTERLETADAQDRSGQTRRVLWLLLFLWFSALANHRFGDPAGLYPRVQSLFRARTPEPQPTPGQAQPPARVTPPVVSTPVPPKKTTPLPPPPQTVGTFENRVTAMPPDAAFHRELAGAYQTGGITAMQSVVKDRLAAGYTHFEFKAIQEALAAVEPLDALAIRALEQIVQTEIMLNFQGKNRRVVPKAVADGEVVVYFPEQKRHVTLKIASISDAEKVRLLGPNLTPQLSASVCFRLLETGNAEAAQPYAAASGSLTGALTLLAAE